MYKKYFIIIFLFISSAIIIYPQSEINLRGELNDETYKKWDAYIKKYAPADSAFRVVAEIANRHYFANRSAVTLEVYKLYKDYFPQYDTLFERMIGLHSEIMLTQTPTEDIKDLYVNYLINNAPSRNAFIALQRITDNLVLNKKWDSTIIYYQYFYKYFPKEKELFNKIIGILSANEEGIVINNLGENINTNRNEWDPNPTPDGKYLFFSADHRNGGHGQSDIWYSEMKEGEWQKAQNLGRAVNAAQNETIDNVSLDGNILLLSGDFPGTYGKFDIYTIDRTEDGWGQLQHLPKPVNSLYTDEGAYITADGNALIFTSARPGGIGEFRELGSYGFGSIMGNMDIYVSLKQEDGLWGEPINLGPTINTPYSERSPFLHPDGKTLYFSSDGHPGLGRLDVFKSVRLSEDSWTEWSEPINLGKEINSSLDDWGYKVGVTGDSAFFAAHNRSDGFGGWDLYSVALPSFAKPIDVVTVSGKVTDTEGKPLSAKIKWEDLNSGEKIGTLKSNPNDGSYFIALPKGKNYGYFAEKDGYYPTSQNLNLTNSEITISVKKDIILASVEDFARDTIRITVNNIFFDYDEYILKKESIYELNRLVSFLTTNKNLKIDIEGHTDEQGTAEYNLLLSLKRAEAVKNYLISNGIKAERIKHTGYGSSHPIAPNDSEENRAMNRRVSIFFRE